MAQVEFEGVGWDREEIEFRLLRQPFSTSDLLLMTSHDTRPFLPLAPPLFSLLAPLRQAHSWDNLRRRWFKWSLGVRSCICYRTWEFSPLAILID